MLASPTENSASSRHPSRLGLAAVVGFLVGGALACKYPSVGLVLLPIAAWMAWRERGVRSPLVMTACSIVPFAPWLLKNWSETGNPVYPLVARLFGGETLSPDKIAQWNKAHATPNWSPVDLANRVIDLIGRSEFQSAILAPLLIASAWFAFRNWRIRDDQHDGNSEATRARRESTIITWLALYALAYLALWWIATHRIDRFWTPLLPVFALLAGIGATCSNERWWRVGLRVTLVAIVVANTMLVLMPNVGHTYGPGGYTRFFVPLEAMRNSPERVEPWHLYLNQQVKPGDAALVVGDAEVFDIEPKVYYSTTFDTNPLEAWLRDRTPADLAKEFAERRITHVYFNWPEIARYRATYGFTDFITPELARSLVEAGVLSAPLPPIEGYGGQMFEVKK